jgi:hypothetical protein
MRETYTGINIQYPISRLIISGEKTIETRTYPIPEKYIGKELLLIETPGKVGRFNSRVVAKIIFAKSFKYQSVASFYQDTPKHQVDRNSEWAWDSTHPKWGWPIVQVVSFKQPIVYRKQKGIVFTTNICLDC